MQIQVRVAAGQAAATLRALGLSVNGLNAGLGGTSVRSRGASRDLAAWGNQLQWTGRQLQTNWTLPLLAAAGAATKMELENEKAFTRIAKVYGTAGMSASTIKNELNSLSKAFEGLSNHFGVQKKEVLEIAGDWAAAGASGKAMFTAVRTTLEAMILGEMKAADTTKALIAIQAQYGTDAAGLAKIIGTLNSVENETGVSMAGLIQGFARSAGVARQAGVDYRHLAAMIAALSPAAGTAAEAGNALKTIFSRLSSPTKETTQIFALMGIHMTDLNWKSATATEQLQILSKAFGGLSDKQKEVVSTVVASRWQINKFSILMRELSSQNGYYQKALKATNSDTKVFSQYQRELNAVLSSNPQRMQQIWVMLQNAGTDIIQPMIPMLLYLANSLRMVLTAFSNLDPALQKFIMFSAFALVAIGPLLRYLGSLVTLLAELGRMILFAFKPFTLIPKILGAVATAVEVVWAEMWIVMSGTMAIASRAMLTALGYFVTLFPMAVIHIQSLWTAVWRAAWFALRTAGQVIWGQILVAWGMFLGRMRAVMASGLATLRLLWTASLGGFPVLMSTIGGLISGVWTTLMGRLGTITAAGGRLISVLYRNGLLLLAAVQLAVGRAVMAAFEGMMMGIAFISSYVWPVVQRIWYAGMTGVYIVMNAGQQALLAMYRATSMGFSGIAVAAGALMQRAWYAVQLGMEYILLGGQAVMHTLWRVYMYGLAPITAAAGRTVQTLWTATLTGMNTLLAAARPAFAAGWAAMVAIARLGSMAIAAATTFGRTGIGLLATMPARVGGLFRAGFMGLVGIARGGITQLGALLVRGVAALFSPVGLAIAAVALLVAAFWDDIKKGFNNVVKYFSNSGNSLAVAVRNIFGSIGNMMSRVFNMLPNTVKNAMLAVLKLIATAAHKIYDLFSYINPFAHHSPSLVENVTKGMAIVGQQFTGTLGNVEKAVMSAYGTLQKFGGVAAGAGAKYQEAQWSDQRANIKKVQPSALPAFDALTAQIRRLTPLLNQLDAAVKEQQKVVDAWSAKLDAANAVLDKQQKKLDDLKNKASDLGDQLDAAKQALSDWSNTPIKGQQAMSDAIFANQMASKGLQLQLMQMEEKSGSLSDIKDKMSAINGEIDTLKGLRQDLAQGGAGSDILGVYDQQIKDLQGKGGGLAGPAKAMEDLQKQIDELDKKGQILDLQNSLKFDPLTRQIQEASNTMKEMPFDTIMNGIKNSKAEVDKLTKAYDEANKAVDQQQKVVDAATAARDAIQARYDAEEKKLQKLKDAYDSVNGAIGDINDALQQMTQFADDAIQRAQNATKKKRRSKGDSLTQGAQNFVDAAGGNFPDVGGNFQIGREGGLGDQSSAIDQMTKDLAKQTSGMFAGLNPLDPLKKWWDRAWKWLKTYIGPLFSGLGDFLSQAFGGIPNPFAGVSTWGKPLGDMFSGVTSMLSQFWKTFTDIFGSLWSFLSGAWTLIQPILKGIWGELVKGLAYVWQQIAPELAQFKPVLAGVGQMFSELWIVIKPLLAIIGGAVAAAFLLILDVVKNTIFPILQIVGDVIAGVIRIFRGILEFLVGIFTLNFGMIWKGIEDIFGGAWDIITGIISGAWKVLLGILKGIMDWLGQIFAFVWNKVKGPFQDAWGWIVKKATGFKDGFVAVFAGIINWVTTKFNGLMKWAGDAWNSGWGYIVGKAKSFKSDVVGVFTDIKDWVVNKFNGVMDGVASKWKSAWSNLQKWFNDAKDWVSKPLKTGINWAIDAVNQLIKGLNKVADLLPGLDWHIDLIPKLATGGNIPSRRVGNGFKTNGARAIVGEGNPAHPEYVIPTDPMYRRRALGLFGSLASEMGVGPDFVGGIPAYKSGGILGTISDALGSAGNFFKGIGDDLLSHISDGVASYIVDPFFKLADPLVKKINWSFAKDIWNAGKSKIKSWLSFTDDAAKAKYEDGGLGNVPAGRVRDWIGKALGIIHESLSLSKGIYNIIMHESGGNPRAINLTDSNAKAGHPSKGIMQTIDGTFNTYSIKGHKDIWNPVDNIIAGTRYAIANYGRKWLQAGGNKDKNGNYIGYAAGGILGSLKGIPSLADGAYIRRKVGGTLVRVGEGVTDEAVVPLPNGMQSFGESRVFHFHGDLSFPNITSPDDAKAFLDNLDNLAG